MYRCPASLGRGDESTHWAVTKAFESYVDFDTRNALPAPGSILDQSPSFVRFCRIADSERGRVEAKRRERQERQRQQAEQAARMNRPHGRH